MGRDMIRRLWVINYGGDVTLNLSLDRRKVSRLLICLGKKKRKMSRFYLFVLINSWFDGEIWEKEISYIYKKIIYCFVLWRVYLVMARILKWVRSHWSKLTFIKLRFHFMKQFGSVIDQRKNNSFQVIVSFRVCVCLGGDSPFWITFTNYFLK